MFLAPECVDPLEIMILGELGDAIPVAACVFDIIKSVESILNEYL